MESGYLEIKKELLSIVSCCLDFADSGKRWRNSAKAPEALRIK